MKNHDPNRSSFSWYEDPLSLVAILSGCLSHKDLARHGRKAGLWPGGAPADKARLSADIRKACGVDPGLRKKIARQISKRSLAVIGLVRSADPDGIRVLGQKVDSPLHLLWACLTDQREEVRRRGGLMAHELIRIAVRESLGDRPGLSVQGDYEDLRKRHQTLAQENTLHKAELGKVRSMLTKRQEQSPAAPPRTFSPMGNLDQQREIKKLRRQVALLQQELAEKAGAGGGFCPCGRTDLVLPQELEGPGPDCLRCKKRISCCDCPLAGRRVAVIGGLDRMESVYRQVVERLGGEFEFHCGRVKDGCQSVQGLVNRSDYVIYITTINSHASMRATKTICKKNCKRFIALKERGAGSLERKLKEVSQG